VRAQAFINTARKIYEKIEQGVFDVSNEVRACADGPALAATRARRRPSDPPASAPPV
jgi:hypothetical protein